MKVGWTNGAKAELDAILNYIADRNPRAAANVQENIILAGTQLGQFPHMGRAAQRPGTRLWPVTGLPYILTYRVLENRVEIGSVFDARMERPEDLL
jgi:toxin ParE1/3/4